MRFAQSPVALSSRQIPLLTKLTRNFIRVPFTPLRILYTLCKPQNVQNVVISEEGQRFRKPASTKDCG